MPRIALATAFLLILICAFVPAYANSDTEGFDLYSIPQKIQISNTKAEIVRDEWRGGYLRIKNPKENALLYYPLSDSVSTGMELVATNCKITFIGLDSKGIRRNTVVVEVLKGSILLNGEKIEVDFPRMWNLLEITLVDEEKVEVYVDNKLAGVTQTLSKGIVKLSGVLINPKGEIAIDNLFCGDERAKEYNIKHKEYGYGKAGTDTASSGMLFEENFENASNPPKGWTKTSLVASTTVNEEENNKSFSMQVTDTTAYGEVGVTLPKALSTDSGVLDISFSAKLSSIKEFEQIVVIGITLSGAPGVITALDFTEDGLIRAYGKTINTPTKIIKDKWNNYRMILYLKSDTFDLYVDGVNLANNLLFKTTNITAVTGLSFRKTAGELSIDNLIISQGVGRSDMKTGDEAVLDKVVKEMLMTSIITKVNNPTMFVLNIKTSAGFETPPQVAYLSQGVVYIPAKAIGQALGALVTVNGETIKMMKKDFEIEANVNSNELFVNGQKKSMKGIVQNKDGVLYIPVSEIASAFGQNSYTGADGLIVISTVSNISSNAQVIKALNNLF